MHIREIDGDNREPAGLQDEGERLDGALEDAVGQARPERVQRVEGLAANPQQTIEIDGGGRRAGHLQPIAGVDERRDFARVAAASS